MVSVYAKCPHCPDGMVSMTVMKPQTKDRMGTRCDLCNMMVYDTDVKEVLSDPMKPHRKVQYK